MNEPKPTGQSLIDRIARGLPDLSPAFLRVGRYLIAEPEGFMHKPLQEIARTAGVSEPSVIRFCRAFGFKGIADFRIALAISLAGSGGGHQAYLEPNVADKAVVNIAEKRAIARAALGFIGTDRAIILDSGSTTELFAAKLRGAPPLTIMTTGLNIVETLRGANQHTVMLPGGTVRFESRSLSGRLTEETFASMRFDTLFLGADSIDPTLGLSTYNEDEARQNAAMIRVSNRVVVLADSSKFGAPRLHRFCGLEQISVIVTDTGLSASTARDLADRGVQIERANPTEGLI